MENIILTQLSTTELQELLKQSLETFFSHQKKQSETQTEDLLTVKQASAFLHLSVSTIHGKTSRSVIPFMKKGKRLYFSKSELTQWLKTGHNQTDKDIQNETDKFLSQQSLPKRGRRKI